MNNKITPSIPDSKGRIVVFQEQAIRRTWHGEEWWFSVVDVCAVLTGSRDAGAYWRKPKQRLGAEGSEVVTFCHGLKLEAPDGKQRADVAEKLALERYESFDAARREEIDLLGQSVAALKTQKRGLMQKLLTGQWQLSVADAPSPPTPLPQAGEGSKTHADFDASHVGEGSKTRADFDASHAGEGSETRADFDASHVGEGSKTLADFDATHAGEGSKTRADFDASQEEGIKGGVAGGFSPLPRAGEGGRRPGEGQHD